MSQRQWRADNLLEPEDVIGKDILCIDPQNTSRALEIWDPSRVRSVDRNEFRTTRFELVDGVFIPEYIAWMNNQQARTFLTRATSLVRPGGWLLATSLKSRPKPDNNRYQVRTVEDLEQLSGMVATRSESKYLAPCFIEHWRRPHFLSIVRMTMLRVLLTKQ